MEQLLHYCWKHRLLPAYPLSTTDGRSVEVIDTGLHNHNDGPDFFNAKVKIDGTLWVGNVEIHDCSSDWYLHGHQDDIHYDNVVLHVCEKADKEVRTKSGNTVPQVELAVPDTIRINYESLLNEDKYPPCYKVIPELSKLTVHSWMSALQTERLEEKTEAIRQRVEKSGGDWEKAFFITLARNYGFGVNGDAFEYWAERLDLSAAAHHRDDVFQIEAIFMGQAGFLDENNIPLRLRDNATSDEYYCRLRSEYQYLAHKFSLQEMDCSLWRFLRLRPQNFPYIRISQLANLYHSRRSLLSNLCECSSIEQIEELLATHVTQYWESHYTFGSLSKRNTKKLSQSSLQLLIINTVVPMLFAYGRHRSEEHLVDRAFDFLEQLKPEQNNIVRMWKECGLLVGSAGDSQALIQLKRNYCDRRDCLRCRIGFEYLKKSRQVDK